MLHLKKVLSAKPKEHVEVELDSMLTPWGERLDAGNVLEEHPTPQFARSAFRMLNGEWSCTFVESGHDPQANLALVTADAVVPAPEAFDQPIVVPFSPESLLSGVSRRLEPDELLWYRRVFAAPAYSKDDCLLLHFQAVDYACAVRINGHMVGTHTGGYSPFCFDITDYVSEGENELCVCVADPSEFGGHLRGKQRFDRGDIWYSAQSGIWQSVWLEVVPKWHIDRIRIDADAATNIVAVGAYLAFPTREYNKSLQNAGVSQSDAGSRSADASSQAGADAPLLRVEALDEAGAVIACGECVAEKACAVALRIPDARTWSPEDPYLYTLRITFGADEVMSYCGFRKVEVKADDAGCKRVFLNGRPLFIKGVLDQAYWSDGLMTAPSDDALVFDIESMKAVGFNLMRKHIKVESERWYYHCDRLGMLVLQDMVNGGAPEINKWHWSYKPTLFKASWSRYRDDVPSHQEKLGAGSAAYQVEWTKACRSTVEQLRNHPCIIGWSLFNEGWGQFNARAACDMVRALDPTRFIDAVSGWYDQRCGDFSSVHNYFRDMKVWTDRRGERAFFISEFGGLTHRVDGHSSLEEAYGYETYDDLQEWREAVHEVLQTVEALEPDGLAGYVFTQVSDIEEETNGILTYDRKVNKLAAGACREIET